MQETYTQKTRPVKSIKHDANYILRIGGAQVRVRATHGALLELVRILLGGAKSVTLAVRP